MEEKEQHAAAKPGDTHKLRRTSDVFYIVKGEPNEDGTEYRAYSMEVLGHEGHGLVTKGKVTSGEDYATQPNGGFVIPSGTTYFHDVPHGDVGQGNTFVFPDEVPADFYVG